MVHDTDDVKQGDGGVDLEAEDRLTEAHLVVTTLAKLLLDSRLGLGLLLNNERRLEQQIFHEVS